MQIRIVGTEDEVARAAEKIAAVLNVLENSGPRPRRNGSQVQVYLEARLDTGPGPAVVPGTIVRDRAPGPRGPRHAVADAPRAIE